MSQQKNNIICVFWGTKYPIKFVNILYSMVKRNMTLPFDFYCLTDELNQAFDTGIKTIKIPNPQLDGWWNKMHLYNKELNIEGNILYVDLDVVIISCLDKIFTEFADDKFCVIKDFGQPKTTINSSVLRYNLKHHSHIWDNFLKDKGQYDSMHGDQNVLTSMLYTDKQTVFMPDEWTYSFKWPERGKPKKYDKYVPKNHPLKKEALICVFHGHPNPDYAMEYDSGKWIKDYWK